MSPKRAKRMDLVASVSRSSGLQSDGDSLKDPKLQNEYREFLQDKVHTILQKHDRQQSETSTESKRRLDDQENLLILFRKLREGIISSSRADNFALEVYETSFYLALVFDVPRQVTPVMPHLVDTYLKSPGPHHNVVHTIVLCLLYHLVTTYPSQLSYHQFYSTLPPNLLPQDNDIHIWIKSLSAALRTSNYTKVEPLTTPSKASQLFGNSDARSDLARKAFFLLIEKLREKARNTAWRVIRSAYREVACQAESEGTRMWLSRSLHLQTIDLDRWLDEQSTLGHVRRKEDVPGRWLLTRVR